MKLFETGRIGRLVLKNRIVMAPMGNIGLVELDGRFSPRAIDYFAARAKGGTGLIITGVVFVDTEIEGRLEKGWANVPRIDGAVYLARLNELADAVHQWGAKLALQFSAGFGRVAVRHILRLGKSVGPSAVPCYWDPRVTTRELTIEEIERLVDAFGFGAGIAKAAGVDAIELHGHEGYLLDQFSTALWNHRTDKYGGDLDGRLTFPLEVIKQIKAVAGKDFPVIYRFGIKHYLEGGREVEEGLEIARRLEAAGVDALDVDAGCYETWHWAHPPTYQPPGCMVDMAEMVKKVVKIPVIAVGKLGYPELAQRVLEEGNADFIALGRALLADPEWPNKVREGKLDDICPCIGDQEGCLTRIFSGRYLSCTVNPACGMERDFELKPAERSKSVLVIGGGPGGMEAARVAALRGHKVSLWEKSTELGGNLIPSSVPDFKADIKSLTNYLSTQIKKLGVDIELGKEATAPLVERARPDVVILAAGSTTLIPDIPGINKEKVVTAVDLLLNKGEVDEKVEKVVVAGGGMVGCEVAVYLARKGKRVTVVEMTGRVAQEINPANRIQLLQMMDEAEVEILTESEVLEIKDNGVVVRSKEGTKTLPADSVVLALGFKPERGLEQRLKAMVPELYSIGDCVEPRRILNAMWEAYHTARLI